VRATLIGRSQAPDAAPLEGLAGVECVLSPPGSHGLTP